MTVKKYGWIMLAVLLVLIAAVLIVGFQVRNQQLDAIIIDPIYKVITGDENSASDMAAFCNQFDKICIIPSFFRDSCRNCPSEVSR